MRRRGGRGRKLKQNSEANEGSAKAPKEEAVNALGKPRRAGDAPHRQQQQQQPTNLSSLGKWKEAYLELRRLFPNLRVGSRESMGQIATLLVLYCPSQGPPERAPAVVKGKPVVYEKCGVCGNRGGHLNAAEKQTVLQWDPQGEEEEELEEEKEPKDSGTNTLEDGEEEEACPECSSVACAKARREVSQILAAEDPKHITMLPPCRERSLNYLGDWKEAFLELQRLFSPMPVSAERKTRKGEIYTLLVLYCGDPPQNAPAVVKGKPVVYEKGYLVDS